MEKELFVTCDFAQENAGKLTTVGIFDVINSHQFPFVHNFFAAARLKFDKSEVGKYDIKIALKDPNNVDVLAPSGGTAEVLGNSNNQTATLNVVVNMVIVTFKEPGNYECQLIIGNEVKYSIPLYVMKT